MIQPVDTGQTVTAFKRWISVHGVPRILETDNGPQFASAEFKEFTKSWNIEHRTSSPRFPRSNGLAERAVQAVKYLFRKCTIDKSDIYEALLNIRNVPRNSVFGSPVQRLFSRQTRTPMPTTETILRPKIQENVQEELERHRMIQKKYADPQHHRSLEPGNTVRVYQENRNWIPGQVITKRSEPRSYDVQLQSTASLPSEPMQEVRPPPPEVIPDVPATSQPTADIPPSSGTCSNRHRTTRYGRTIKAPDRLNL
ncbi:PREDICTED: uncharacterized protein K02A2.6-like [Cyphomyrmex costatus]|uniref:uncharacterized protein K02A2.6-like n=1 Tax=Cyphomyrmex costatus TaxID=456900 RepID=UPI0008521EC4|nr:PREDICTED: uncharacterized protein K02A2.6-like [Cyphomyrmex costatus]